MLWYHGTLESGLQCWDRFEDFTRLTGVKGLGPGFTLTLVLIAYRRFVSRPGSLGGRKGGRLPFNDPSCRLDSHCLSMWLILRRGPCTKLLRRTRNELSHVGTLLLPLCHTDIDQHRRTLQGVTSIRPISTSIQLVTRKITRTKLNQSAKRQRYTQSIKPMTTIHGNNSNVTVT